jgi:hypothetical protein
MPVIAIGNLKRIKLGHFLGRTRREWAGHLRQLSNIWSHADEEELLRQLTECFQNLNRLLALLTYDGSRNWSFRSAEAYSRVRSCGNARQMWNIDDVASRRN